ncbi:MAG: phage late control D family protein [Campylobacter sp.]
MKNFHSPRVKILYNGIDKTDQIGWIDISIEDFESDEADVLRITMHWQNAKPREEDNIKIYVDDNFLGDFTISTIKYNYKISYEIEAISANYFKEFREKKNRTFEEMSYKEILTSIAKENGYEIKADFQRMDEITDLEQYDTSDCAFCKNIADDLELTFCIKSKTLIFIDKDKSRNRPEYELKENEIIDLNYQINHTKEYKSAIIRWFDREFNEWAETQVGNGRPVLKFSQYAIDENDAERIAQAKLKRQKNSVLAGSVTTMGVPFFAGGYITLSLNDEPKKIRAIISKITHKINSSWTSTVEFF